MAWIVTTKKRKLSDKIILNCETYLSLAELSIKSKAIREYVYQRMKGETKKDEKMVLIWCMQVA